ncbi:MAG: competence/damage-inducible protein A [Bacteroidia bacterium]|nr:competence/damage-inducible protein A [Bacteroidia bacterium]
MRAEIISIGDELLIGQVINTNAAKIGEMLNLAGIKVVQVSTIADDKLSIINSFNAAREKADLVLITGGLGPTKDDITKNTLCEYFKTKLVLNQEMLENVKAIFAKRNIVLSEVNKKQAEVPENCIAIKNNNGTAPGMWFEVDGKIFVSMPGVPFETIAMMENFVIPKLKAEHDLPFIYHKTILTQGKGESDLAALIEDWEDSLAAKNIKLAYLPSPGMVRLRLSAYGENHAQIIKNVEDKITEVLPTISKYVYGFEEFGKPVPKIESILGNLLLSKNKKIALAESCTGGYISHLLTTVAGSSAWFNGSIVPYHNQFKNELLNVNNKIFSTAGAVSEECVKEMAEGVLKKFNSDYAIAVSGIAGPSGGTEEKPVGTVWIAWSSTKETKTRKFIFGHNRERNIHLTAINALNGLRRMIEDEGF